MWEGGRGGGEVWEGGLGVRCGRVGGGEVWEGGWRVGEELGGVRCGRVMGGGRESYGEGVLMGWHFELSI